MAPFRPSNLNKRTYPGNASVIGPDIAATLGVTTTSCQVCYNTCSACSFQPLPLGCRCDFCACPCCDIVCGCDCTVCDRTVPSGMWKTSEQYEAKKRDAWGDDSCSTGATTCLCNINCSFTCISYVNDYGGFFVCCGPSTSKWYVAPICTQLLRNWYCRCDATTCATSLIGSCSWFIASCTDLINMANCRTYWDAYCTGPDPTSGPFTRSIWSDQDSGAESKAINISTGCVDGLHFGQAKSHVASVRGFRCTAT